MDACSEPHNGYYIVANRDDWVTPYFGSGGYGYWYVYHWDWWDRVFEYEGLYYDRVNKYNIEDMFDDFFNE